MVKIKLVPEVKWVSDEADVADVVEVNRDVGRFVESILGWN